MRPGDTRLDGGHLGLERLLLGKDPLGPHESRSPSRVSPS